MSQSALEFNFKRVVVATGVQNAVAAAATTSPNQLQINVVTGLNFT